MTIALTYRNRDLQIVEKCLDSLKNQSNTSFQVILVDYGSEDAYASSLSKITANYPFVKLISCPVKKQLWNKSRAINIALKECTSDFFFVADIDMIFHDNFIEKLNSLKNGNEAIYFQVGFLSEDESKKNKPFNGYNIKHVSGKEATGMTMYSTALLKSINGYDEFYHGWGAEDTDVHIRLQNKKVKVTFFKDEIFILHQWHPKLYRTAVSEEPYHTKLEKINYQYIQQAQKNSVIQANNKLEWGLEPVTNDYLRLNTPTHNITISNEQNDVNAFLFGTIFNLKDVVLNVNIEKHLMCKSSKNLIKKILGKKHYKFFSLDEINDSLLLTIISSFRNQPYEYRYLKEKERIQLRIKL